MYDFNDRVGSLSLRSNHMNYSRSTLNSNWHQVREAEPKDYDFNKSSKRSFTAATYKRIAEITDGTLPPTTYMDLANDYCKKSLHPRRTLSRPMVTEGSCIHLNLSRETGLPKLGPLAILPRHGKDHLMYYHSTTHRSDFKTPREMIVVERPMLVDESLALKKPLSQFSDVANHRRCGRNHWADESGHYANSHLRAQSQIYAHRNPFQPNALHGPAY